MTQPQTHPRDKFDYAEDLIERVAKDHGKSWLQVKADACAANGDDSFRRKLNRAKTQGWATAQTFKALADEIGCEFNVLVKHGALISTQPSNYVPELVSLNFDFFQASNVLADVYCLDLEISVDNSKNSLEWPFRVIPTRILIEFQSSEHVNFYLLPTANRLLVGAQINPLSPNRFELVSTSRGEPLPVGMILGPELEAFRASWNSNKHVPVHVFMGISDEADLMPQINQLEQNLDHMDARQAAIEHIRQVAESTQNLTHRSDKIKIVLSHQTLVSRNMELGEDD